MQKRSHTKHNLKPSVLVVEDDEAILTLVQYNLEKNGFSVRMTKDGDEALVMVEENTPDVILLDWMLPGKSGIELCNRLRKSDKYNKIPIIMISAKGEETDRIEGLDTGADDYLVKPFSPKELVARIKAVFRRVRPVFTAKSLKFGVMEMELETRRVLCRGKDIHLGPTEYKLLQALMEYPNRVLSREQIMRRVWGCDLHVEPRTVDVHINRLRKAMDLEGSGTAIKTIRGAGYAVKFENMDDAALQRVADSEVPDLEEVEGDEGI